MSKLPFVFDASQHKPWQGAAHDTPLETALRLWSKAAEDDLSFEEACELAAYDREVYDDLWEWAVKHREVMAEGYKAPLFESLVRLPPRKGKGETARRHARLRWVAARLVDQYPEMMTTPGVSRRGPSPESILAQLKIPGMPSEKSIRNLLGKNLA